ncbi:hypothetical protein EQZ23_04290 [Sphingomonas sp. UV9]|uniref:antibiotic biosynthesis monooxygenase n=1 Tax=Sphingomonas sp. UV9 TaxID=1851410 RepID=UPI000FFB3F41|nr:antibiotic biosynthesis monooxygenase [Sphingomonas sp. UV9]RXD07283.1 hypothetical protein EQZ23_04290 [Sphingomonas sp. UV9]
MQTDTLHASLAEWHRIVTTRDWDALPALLTDDVTYHNPAQAKSLRGKDAIVATMTLALGVRDVFVRHLAEHRLRCLAEEPGTHAFEILVPHDVPDTVMLYEVYTDQAAFDAHMNGASIAIMRRETVGMVLTLTGVPCVLAV